MSEYLTKIVHLTEAQYATIIGGTAVNGQSYDPSALYITSVSGPLSYTKGGTGLTTLGTAGQVLKVNSGATGLEWGNASFTDVNVTQAYSTTNNSYPLLMTATAGISETTSRGDTTTILNNAIYANPSNGNLYATAVHGAVWNDYAEFRKTNDKAKPGNVVIDNDDGSLTLSYARLLPGAQVVSDTYGFAIGETKETKTPLAVSGRVLVYPYKNKKEYHAGQAVCSAPNGTVDIMTRREIREYPDAIIGIVSEIPEYEEWGTNNVKVDGRIWIKVR